MLFSALLVAPDCLGFATPAPPPEKVEIAQKHHPPDPSPTTTPNAKPSLTPNPAATPAPTPESSGQKGSSDSSISTVFSSLVSAVLIWLAQGLVVYALRRFHLIRTLVVDLAHRSGSAANQYFFVWEWWSKLDGLDFSALLQLPYVPHLKPRYETHVVYKNLQAQLVETLWKDEILEVRSAYRRLELIETRMEHIQKAYEHLIVELQKMETRTHYQKYNEKKWLLYTKEEIRFSISKYHEHLIDLFRGDQGLSKRVQEAKTSTEEPFILSEPEDLKVLMEMAYNRFMPIHIAYGTQLVAPLFVILWFFLLFVSRPLALPICNLYYLGPLIEIPFVLLLWKIQKKKCFKWPGPCLIICLLVFFFWYLGLVSRKSQSCSDAFAWLWFALGVAMALLTGYFFCKENTDLVPRMLNWLQDFFPRRSAKENDSERRK